MKKFDSNKLIIILCYIALWGVLVLIELDTGIAALSVIIGIMPSIAIGAIFHQEIEKGLDKIGIYLPQVKEQFSKINLKNFKENKDENEIQQSSSESKKESRKKDGETDSEDTWGC